jgi:hypothetical protein
VDEDMFIVVLGELGLYRISFEASISIGRTVHATNQKARDPHKPEILGLAERVGKSPH